MHVYIYITELSNTRFIWQVSWCHGDVGRQAALSPPVASERPERRGTGPAEIHGAVVDTWLQWRGGPW